MTFGVKSHFFRKGDGFPLKVVNIRKTLKNGSFMRFLRKINILSKNKDKSIKIGSLCNFREKNILSR